MKKHILQNPEVQRLQRAYAKAMMRAGDGYEYLTCPECAKIKAELEQLVSRIAATGKMGEPCYFVEQGQRDRLAMQEKQA